MPKINREEYEVLKALDSRAKSIVRQARGWLWVAEQPIMKDKWSWFVADGFDEKLKGDNLFQFIQWEDDEPHNIAELIEEYESVETEVKKSKLWAKLKIQEELEIWEGVEGGIDEDGINYVLNIIDQLNEPEVLSKEWIRNNQERKGVHFFVNVTKLQNLLVPKQELPVSEEPRYYALIKGHELLKGKGDWVVPTYWCLDTINDNMFISDRITVRDKFLVKMSKSEWNKLGINESNADFVRLDGNLNQEQGRKDDEKMV